MITRAPDPMPMLTVNQVAKRLQVDAEVVRGWCRSGALRCVNVGRGKLKPRYRVTPEALEEFVRARTIGPPPPKPRRRRKRQGDVIQFF